MCFVVAAAARFISYIYYTSESGDLLRLRNVHEAHTYLLSTHVRMYYTGWFRSFVQLFVGLLIGVCLFVVLC